MTAFARSKGRSCYEKLFTFQSVHSYSERNNFSERILSFITHRCQIPKTWFLTVWVVQILSGNAVEHAIAPAVGHEGNAKGVERISQIFNVFLIYLIAFVARESWLKLDLQPQLY
jgi:hypothetical protein